METNQNKKTATKGKKTNKTLAAFMVFIFPILAVFIGAILGQYIGNLITAPINACIIVGGVIAFAIAIVIIYFFNKSAVVDPNEEPITWDDM